MFSALACVAFAFSGFASNEVVNFDYELSKSINDNSIDIVLNLGDLDQYTDKEITEIIEKALVSIADEELTCTVTVTGSVNIGVATVEISVSVSGPCAEIKKNGNEIATQVLNEIKKELKK